MENDGGTLRCVPGNMPLSRHLADALVTEYAAAVRDGKPAQRAAVGRWHCPACAVVLDELMSCPDCGRSLKRFHYELLELHPHGTR